MKKYIQIGARSYWRFDEEKPMLGFAVTAGKDWARGVGVFFYVFFLGFEVDLAIGRFDDEF